MYEECTELDREDPAVLGARVSGLPVSEPVLRPASEEAAADIQENDQVTTGGTT